MIKYLHMKYKKIAKVPALLWVIPATFLLAGCVSTGGMRMGSPKPPPLDPATVMVLSEPPDWPYKVVGLVQAQGTRLAKDIDVFRDVRNKAAAIGAPAVIVDDSFEDFSATPGDDALVGVPLKGRAIAPVHLTPEEHRRWAAQRAAMIPKVPPKIQTIGEI